MTPPPNFWYHDTVSALAYSVAQSHFDPNWAESAPPYNDLTNFVLRQQAQMPDYLRRPMLAATLGFDLGGYLRNGALFHGLPASERSRQITAWKQSKLGFQRDLIRYYESLATLALYSREPMNDERAALAPKETNSTGVITSPPHELKCEIAIVGSGPGGAITACLLAESGRDVLLIEEGPYYELESCPAFSKEAMLQKYRNGGQTVALGKNNVAYVEGRCVGGGSEINSGLYHRTPPEILEVWRKEFQVDDLTPASLLPHFEAGERDVSVSLLSDPAPAASLKLHDGAVSLGWKSFEVPRWFSSRPGIRNHGTRQSMTKTFLPRFLKSGGHVLPRARIERFRKEGEKWLLHGTHSDGKAIRIEAETLFLAAGAIQTPALLRRSGITQNIGNSLRLHPTVKVVAKFPEEVNSVSMGVPVHQVKEFAPRFSFGCGISSPAYLALGLIDHPEYARELHRAWPHLASYYVMISGGKGTVRALPGYRDPLVRYELKAEDRRDLAQGLKKLSELLFEAGAVGVYPGISRAAALRSRDDLGGLPEILPPGLANLITIHLFSSCPMGEDKSRCATDSFGRVHGFDRLHIADASLLCTAPGVNPQGSIMALARRNALRFLKQV
jgi:choline dehydrogenase-like flavoprotein